MSSALRLGIARAVSSPSISQRARAMSSIRSRVMRGTRTDRFGIASSACSDTSRASASRTGMVLVCKVSARSTMRSTCPASNTP